jgi:hypothetical protein
LSQVNAAFLKGLLAVGNGLPLVKVSLKPVLILRSHVVYHDFVDEVEGLDFLVLGLLDREFIC